MRLAAIFSPQFLKSIAMSPLLCLEHIVKNLLTIETDNNFTNFHLFILLFVMIRKCRKGGAKVIVV